MGILKMVFQIKLVMVGGENSLTVSLSLSLSAIYVHLYESTLIADSRYK